LSNICFIQEPLHKFLLKVVVVNPSVRSDIAN
jgi:hypothetical protein